MMLLLSLATVAVVFILEKCWEYSIISQILFSLESPTVVVRLACSSFLFVKKSTTCRMRDLEDEDLLEEMVRPHWRVSFCIFLYHLSVSHWLLAVTDRGATPMLHNKYEHDGHWQNAKKKRFVVSKRSYHFFKITHPTFRTPQKHGKSPMFTSCERPELQSFDLGWADSNSRDLGLLKRRDAEWGISQLREVYIELYLGLCKWRGSGQCDKGHFKSFLGCSRSFWSN